MKMNLSLLKIDSSIASMLKKTSLTSLRLDRNMLKIFTPEELKILIYRCIVKKINTKFTNRTYGFWTQFYIFIKESRTGAEFLIDKMLFLSNRNFIDVICDYEEKNKLEKIKLINGVRWLNTKFEVQDIQNMSVSENRHIFLLSPSIYNKGLHIRQWKNGDRILSSTSGKSILLSNLFINNKLSKYEKYIQPIITNGKDEILWIPGMLHREGNLQFKSKNKVIRWIEN